MTAKGNKAAKSREEILENPDFGIYTGEHMMRAQYKNGQWSALQLQMYAPISFDPALMALHYGQSVFEGMKAYRHDSGEISAFRIEKHLQRFQRSLERMCMPEVPESFFYEGIPALLAADHAWVPSKSGHSYYLRPFMFASEARYGVKVSDEYEFIIFGGPVAAYFKSTIRVKVETEFIRSAPGGTGYAKCAGNYGAAFFPTQKARSEGFDQVIWTDAKENKYIEESGTMNVFFRIGEELITPALHDSILDGVTRDSVITLAKQNNLRVSERAISINELETAFRSHQLLEAFGAGTAASLIPITEIRIGQTDYAIPERESENWNRTLRQQLDDIRRGRSEDLYHWNSIVANVGR